MASRSRSWWSLLIVLTVAGLGVRVVVTGQSTRRETLDRFGERFASEIYPLMSRQVNGCKSCHSGSTKRMFQVLDSPKATFSLILERELLDQQDPMFIIRRLLSKDPELHMPKVGKWSEEEIERVRSFATSMQNALNHLPDAGERADERFPDSLLLPYDGKPQDDHPVRLMSYYQLRESMGAVFGASWFAKSGQDPFENKARALGGADFKTSFEISRTPSANYLNGWQEIAREIARRYVSADSAALFPGFDPNALVAQSPKIAARNVRALYQRILFRDPSPEEQQRSLQVVDSVQKQTTKERLVRFSLDLRDEDGLEDHADLDVMLRKSDAHVSRFIIDETQTVPEENSWVRVGSHSFHFEANNPEHLLRLVDVPGNHVTAFDAVKLVLVENGKETTEVIIDNSDAECTTYGDWRAIPKNGDFGRQGANYVNFRKKYDIPLSIVGLNHLESRNLINELRYVTVALRLPRDGDYNVYMSWPAIPERTRAAMLEVHSGTPADGPVPVAVEPVRPQGFAAFFMDQTESTMNETGEDQWQVISKRAYFDGTGDYVQISNQGVDSTKYIISADAVKFESLDGAKDIIIDNEDKDGLEKSDGWAVDVNERTSQGRGVMWKSNYLSYPPANNGRVPKDVKVEPKPVWVRFRPVSDGQYRPGWYRVSMWNTGGLTHFDQVPVEIRATKFAPVAMVERAPIFQTGEVVRFNATASYQAKQRKLQYKWTNDAADLGLQIEGADTATPSFKVPALPTGRTGWAALIEALLQYPEFLMPTSSPDASPRQKLIRTSLDLVGRVPTQEEIRRIDQSKRLEPLLDTYLASDDFRNFFFYRARVAMMSQGTDEADEPARLWTYLASHDVSYRDLFTADYSIDSEWRRVARPPEAGHTGILTMKGISAGSRAYRSSPTRRRFSPFRLGCCSRLPTRL